jgi:hypothetical protein
VVLVILALGALLLIPWIYQEIATDTVTEDIATVALYRSGSESVDEQIIRRDDRQSQSLRPGERYDTGHLPLQLDYASIQTHTGGVLLIQLADTTTIVLAPQTSLSLDQRDDGWDIRIDGQGMRRSSLRTQDSGRWMQGDDLAQPFALSGASDQKLADFAQSLLGAQQIRVTRQWQDAIQSHSPSSWTASQR